MATRARERLLRTAEELFYAEGTRAVGVEQILDESGVGRASFYRHFRSKDDLVIEVLRSRDAVWRAWLTASVDASDRPATERSLAVFDALAERFARQDFRGCAFINTMVEAADRDSAAHSVAVDHKRKVVAYLDDLLASSGHTNHAILADQFSLLVDGAIVIALREGTVDAAQRARTIAELLLAKSG